MRYPKLKQPRLCRFVPYAVVLGITALPSAIVLSLSIPDIFKVLVILCSLVGLIYYIVRNFIVLMGMDALFATLSCHRTARTQYVLPKNRMPKAIRRSVMNYGRACTPTPYQPQPAALRYKFSAPLTVYSSGIERVLASYETDYLDEDTYRSILRSAKVNSTALIGKRKALFLEKAQKKSPLHRVTVVLILARSVDPRMVANLYERVCRQCGSEEENCTIPCVVDLSRHTCVFNSLRVPYIGYEYAVKNRGIRIIKNCVFGGNLNLKQSTDRIPSIQDVNPEDSVWDIWKTCHHEIIGADRKTKRLFESFIEKELFLDNEALYLKWDQRGICQSIKLDTGKMIAKVEVVSDWYYPKIQPMSKKTAQKIREHIIDHFKNRGYTVEFMDIDAFL